MTTTSGPRAGVREFAPPGPRPCGASLGAFCAPDPRTAPAVTILRPATDGAAQPHRFGSGATAGER